MQTCTACVAWVNSPNISNMRMLLGTLHGAVSFARVAREAWYFAILFDYETAAAHWGPLNSKG